MSLSAIEKKELYQRHLASEIIKECSFVCDVLRGRNSRRTDITDIIIGWIVAGVDGGLSALQQPATGLISFGIGNLYSMFRERRAELSFRELVLEIYQKQDIFTSIGSLELIADEAARTAANMYEYGITELLSDDPNEGIFPLAHMGARRIIAHLAQSKLPLIPKNILEGLVTGASGRGHEGFFNQKIRGKNRIWLTVEGFYRRAAYRIGNQIFAQQDYPRMPVFRLWRSQNLTENFYVNSNGQQKISNIPTPKYGYIALTSETNFLKPKSYTHCNELSNHYKNNAHPHTVQEVTEQDIVRYMENEVNKYTEKKPFDLKTFNTYIQEFYMLPTPIAAAYHGKVTCSLKRGNFRNVDFSKIDLSDCESLDEAIFDYARFSRAIFERNAPNQASAVKASFRYARLDFIVANGINFEQAELIGASLHYAKLNKASLKYTKLAGIDLKEVDVEGADFGDHIEWKKVLDDVRKKQLSLEGRVDELANENLQRKLENEDLERKLENEKQDRIQLENQVKLLKKGSILNEVHLLPDPGKMVELTKFRNELRKSFCYETGVYEFLEHSLRKGENNIVALVGQPGIGKLQTALQFAHKKWSSEDYFVAAKINGSLLSNKEDNFYTSYIAFWQQFFNIRLIPSEETVLLIKASLKNKNLLDKKEILLIIDDVEDYKIIDLLPLDCSNVYIILTATSAAIENKIPRDNIFKMKGLSDDLIHKILEFTWGEQKLRELDALLPGFITQVGRLPTSILIGASSVKKEAELNDNDYRKGMQRFLEVGVRPKRHGISFRDQVKDAEKINDTIFGAIDLACSDLSDNLASVLFLSLFGCKIQKDVYIKYQKSIDPSKDEDDIISELGIFLERSLIRCDADYIYSEPIINEAFFSYISRKKNEVDFSHFLHKVFDQNLIDSISMENLFLFVSRFLKLYSHAVFFEKFKFERTKLFVENIVKLMGHYIKTQNNRKAYKQLDIVQYCKNICSNLGEEDLIKFKKTLSDIFLNRGVLCIRLINEEFSDAIENRNIYFMEGEECLKESVKLRNELKDLNAVIESKYHLAVLYMNNGDCQKSYDEFDSLVNQLENNTFDGLSNDQRLYSLAIFHNLKRYLIKKEKILMKEGITNEALKREISEREKSIEKAEEVDGFDIQYLSHYYIDLADMLTKLLDIEIDVDETEKQCRLKKIEDSLKHALEKREQQVSQHPQWKYQYPDQQFRNYSLLIDFFIRQKDKSQAEKYWKLSMDFIKEQVSQSGSWSFLSKRMGELNELREKLDMLLVPKQPERLQVQDMP